MNNINKDSIYLVTLHCGLAIINYAEESLICISCISQSFYNFIECRFIEATLACNVWVRLQNTRKSYHTFFTLTKIRFKISNVVKQREITLTTLNVKNQRAHIRTKKSDKEFKSTFTYIHNVVVKSIFCITLDSSVFIHQEFYCPFRILFRPTQTYIF